MRALFGQRKQVLAPRSPNERSIWTARAGFGSLESECESYSDSTIRNLLGVRDFKQKQ